MRVLPFQTEIAQSAELPGVRTLRIKGSVTYHDAPELRDWILQEVAQTPAPRLVLSLGDVEKMDTAGAAVLVEALLEGQKRGLRMLLCTPSESVLRMFRLAGLEQVLEHCCANSAETKRRLLQ